jgi:ADP-heptose:LPS heptosyltransferase
MRQITTCSGLGDFCFIAQKIINQPEKFDWVFPASQPRRAFQLEEVLPQLINSVSHEEKLTYRNIASRNHLGKWSAAKKQKFFLSANEHLESGKRIEDFLPDLDTSFNIPFQNIPDMELTTDGPTIGIYTSAYSMARQWNGWGHIEWLNLINKLLEVNKDYRFVIFGASYDVGIVEKIAENLLPHQYRIMKDRPLSEVIAVMRKLEMAICFPSGIPIIHELCGGKRTIMLYPSHLKKMMNTWADPERIKDGRYKGCQFCPPEQIFDWIKTNWL